MKRYFTEQDPTFWNALLPALVLVAVIYTRSPTTNCIFDEQEALLANPYVNGDHLLWRDAFTRDFWGLPPTGSIGSYRPIPNLIWRALWRLREHPWLPHWVNLMFHAINAALLCRLAMFIAPRKRGFAWLTGFVFLASAVLTEAVTGVVGIADVLGGMGVLLALLCLRLPAWAMPFGVFISLLFGLFSKESAIVAVPLIAWAGLVLAPLMHPKRPLRVPRALLSLVGAVAALVLYTELRKRWFPVALPEELTRPLPASEPLARRALHAFMAWFAQPRLPKDPINNPLVDADMPHRIAGALRVYARGIGQTLFPWKLAGDYSFPQEPIPPRLLTPTIVSGGLAMFLAPLVAIGFWIASLVRVGRERRAADAASESASEPQPEAASASTEFGGEGALWSPRVITYALLALALVWVPIAYFPHSNIPVLLPTVRAERFWYLPVIGLAPLYAWALLYISRWRVLQGASDRMQQLGRWAGVSLVAGFFVFQLQSARMHALDYTNDLVFWRATAQSSSNSAKAHLNYSVMLGARGFMEQRLVEGKKAMELAPEWPMAHIYYGDALCRMQRAGEAWPYYKRGFELNPADQNLISLALQCLWDEKAWEPHKQELLDLADANPGSWLAFLARDLVYNGEKHNGVDPKYRPRGYNEGPKKD
ncbi:MAG: tetratricopeptide repeat protein [Myxococcales bacterium]|nr:tetratricopeptide repeat protein [Myxococcales bacterium]